MAEEEMKDFEGPITIERGFKVDGRKLTVQVTFPARAVEDVGMEELLLAANRALINVDTKNHKVEKLK